MKKRILLYLLISSGNLFGQTAWENVPQATQFSPTDIEFTDLNNGWATSINGYIAHTNDGGDTWSLQGSYSSLAATNGIDMLSSTHGYVVGGHSVYETIDGEYWDTIYTDNNDFFGDVSFVNDTLGIVSCGYKILKTTNGGQTWDTIFFNFNFGIERIEFVDENTIAGIGQDYGDGNIIVSHDGGLTWSTPQEAAGLWLTDIHFTGNLTGYIIGQNGTYLTTTDGGLTWQTSTQFQNLLQPYPSIYFTTASTGFVTADYNQRFKTTDGGVTWTDVSPGPGNRNYSSMYFVDSLHGWAASSVLTEIIATSDGGVTWSSVYTGSGWGLTDVVFTSATEGWSCGIRGTVLHTVDGGTTWSLIESPVQTSFLKIGVADPQNIWIVDDQGFGFHTPNGGTNWYYSTVSVAGGNLMDIDFPTSQIGYVAGPSYIHKTVNGGGNWTSEWYPGINYMALDFLNADTGIVLTTETIYRTSDGATVWNDITPTVGIQAYNDIAYPAIDTAYVVGYQGIILSTYDGGDTWTLQNSGTTSVLTDVSFSSSTHGRASGYDGTILVTLDAGVTWLPESTPSQIQISAITSTPNNDAWASKVDGNLLKFHCSATATVEVNSYTLTPDANCNGSVKLSSMTGESFAATFSGQNEVVPGSGDLTGFCEGLYFLDGYTSCGSDLNGAFVIPDLSHYYGATAYADSAITDYLGNVQEFCNYQLAATSSAKLISVSFINTSTIEAQWEISTPSGIFTVPAQYPVSSNGMYAIQLSLYCDGGTFEGLVVNERIYVAGTTVILNHSEQETKSFLVFPNPSTGSFKVIFNQFKAQKVVVTNLIGEEVYSSGISEETSSLLIDLNDLPSGVYMLHVKQSNGETILEKIVKN